jgi:hypothetical protein
VLNEPMVVAVIAVSVKAVVDLVSVCLGLSRENDRDRALQRLVRSVGHNAVVAERRGDGRVLLVWTRGGPPQEDGGGQDSDNGRAGNGPGRDGR